MLTYFIRHTSKLDIDHETRTRLWESRSVAIHYPRGKIWPSDEDMRSLDPGEYLGSARSAVRCLVEIAKYGGYVCAQYSGFNNTLVGKIEAGSEIEILEGKWGDQNKMPGRCAILKSLKLQQVREVSPADGVSILVGRPRQGTVMRWPSAGQTIANLVERRAGSTHLSDLSPAQLEVICSELMRLPDAELLGLPTLASLLLPAGGTMKDIDIYGLATDGKQIFAQVTYSNASEAAWKADRLRPYLVTGDAHGILFCQTDAISRQDGLLTFPIEIAATAFRHSAIGKQWYLSAGK